MGWNGASKVFSNLAEIKATDILKDITIIQKMQTVKNFLFNEETYEKNYVTDRLKSEGKTSIANAYLNKKNQEAIKITSHSKTAIQQEINKRNTERFSQERS